MTRLGTVSVMGAVLVVFLAGVAGAITPKPIRPPATQQDSATAQQQPADTGASVTAAEAFERLVSAPCEYAQESVQQADLCQQWRMANRTQQMAETANAQFWLTWWEVVFVVVAIGVAIWAAREARNAAHAARDSVISTNRAISISQEALAIAREESKKDRAWVTFTEHEVRARVRSGTVIHCQIRVGWKNTGKTPALAAMIAAGAATRRPPTAPMPVFATDWDQHQGPCPIGPDVVMWGDPKIIDATTIRDALSGKCQVFIYSTVRYRDIYSDEWRLSEHCAQLIFPNALDTGVDPLSSEKMFHAFAALRTHGKQNTAS